MFTNSTHRWILHAIALFPVLMMAMFSTAAIAELKPFISNSMDQILAERTAKPFILLLWSIDCAPCMKELQQLQQAQSALSKANLVLISTDGMENHHEAQQVLTEFGLDNNDNWIFSDAMPERLRYRIDPNWFGELPRAYLYDNKHQRISKSGALNQALLEQWLGKLQN